MLYDLNLKSVFKLIFEFWVFKEDLPRSTSEWAWVFAEARPPKISYSYSGIFVRNPSAWHFQRFQCYWQHCNAVRWFEQVCLDEPESVFPCPIYLLTG